MKQFNILTLDTLPSRYRANLVNSCTGYKSLNLIGTQSKNGSQNLAIFNSIIHLGSQPALIGFTTRPLSTQRDTYDNIRDQLIATDGWINLVEAATVAGIGLDGYVLGEKVTRYEYAQPHLAPKIH